MAVRASGPGLYEHTSALGCRSAGTRSQACLHRQERDSTDEMQHLRSKLHLMMEEKASMMQDMRGMMAELMRNDGPSESDSAEGSAGVSGSPLGAEPTAVRGNSAEDSAAVRGSPREAEPTASRQISAAAAAAAAPEGGARRDTTAARGTTFREDASRNVGVTGRRGATVPVEVSPARGQPDQQKGAEEWGSYPGGEVGIGHDMPLLTHALRHITVPSFSEKNPEFTAWTRDVRFYAKGVGFLSSFVSDSPQYIPVGELDTEHSVLVYWGYSRESVRIHALARNFLWTALNVGLEPTTFFCRL